MANLKRIKCPYCEGTGKELNEFDQPVDLFKDNEIVAEKAQTPRTISGKEILNKPCPYCNGTLQVYNI